MTKLAIRHPEMRDAAAIHRLISETPDLDSNSAYMYALLCRDFSATCAVAFENDRLVGVLTGYLRPDAPWTYFAWQTVVSPDSTRHDTAMSMYDLVLDRLLQAKEVNTLEMSIDDNNRAIRLLLSRLARRYHATRTLAPLFSSKELGEDHHPETLHTLSLLAGPVAHETQQLAGDDAAPLTQWIYREIPEPQTPIQERGTEAAGNVPQTGPRDQRLPRHQRSTTHPGTGLS